MATWYENLDAFMGGVLPGGVSPTTPLFSTVEEAAAGGVSGVPLAPATTATLPAIFGGGPAAVGALAPPAPRAAGRARLMTAVARIYPDGSVEPVSMTPGGVALYRRDLSAAKRVKRIGKTVHKLFPHKTRSRGKRK